MNSTQMIQLSAQFNGLIQIVTIVTYASVAVMCLGILMSFRKRG